MGNTFPDRRTVGTAILVVLSVLLAGVAPVTGAATATPSDLGPESPAAVNDTTNDTATATDAAACDPGEGEPHLQMADLHTSEDTIDKESPGSIAGEVVTDGTNECPVKIQLTLNIPNNMYIQGTSDVMSGGSGVVTATFVVQPGDAQSIRAEVYGTEVGEHTVKADITYWPVDHKDMAKEMDGKMLTFTVEEPNEAPDGEKTATAGAGATQADDCTGPLSFLCGVPLVNGLLGIVGMTVAGLLVLVGIAINRDHIHNVAVKLTKGK